MNDLFLSLDCDCISILVLLELGPVFDTADLHILFRRLEKAVGLTGKAHLWFKSNLSDRYRFVRVNNEFLTTQGKALEYNPFGGIRSGSFVPLSGHASPWGHYKQTWC